jgi:16S rRNA (guanine1207-N2)-methyltransferase
MLEAVMDTLLFPWRVEAPAVEAGDEILLVNGRWDPSAPTTLGGRRVWDQPFAPWAEALHAAGERVEPGAGASAARFAHALVLPTPQKEAAFAEIARALLAVKPGGTVTIAAPNKLGAERQEKHLRSLAGEAQVWSRRHCRVAQAVVGPSLDLAAAQASATLDAPRKVVGELLSRPGLFSWDEVDRGSALLLDAVPRTLAGRVADLGAGWGWLSAGLLSRCPGITELHAVEADARGVELAAANLGIAGGAGEVASGRARVLWADATDARRATPMDAVVTNPPFHIGGLASTDAGLAFLRGTLGWLRPEGQLFLVANVHLPYERLLKELYGDAQILVERHGYKVLRAVKPAAAPARADARGAAARRRRGDDPTTWRKHRDR